jgi:hypothetical protein
MMKAEFSSSFIGSDISTMISMYTKQNKKSKLPIHVKKLFLFNKMSLSHSSASATNISASITFFNFTYVSTDSSQSLLSIINCSSITASRSSPHTKQYVKQIVI